MKKNRIVHLLFLDSDVANGYVAVAFLPSHHVMSRNTFKASSSPRASTRLSLYEGHPHWPEWPTPEDASSSDNFNGPIFYNDFEQDDALRNTAEYHDTSSSIPPGKRIIKSPDTKVSHSLNTRISQVTKNSRWLLNNWRKGNSKSFGAFTINEEYFINKEYDPETLPFDYVRHVDIGQYPRVACGSAHGSIFVADTMSSQVLGAARGVHYSDTSEDFVNALDEQLRQYIYGQYDGGGVLDVAMFGKNIVASAGREGGVKLFKLVEKGKSAGATEAELTHQGDVPGLIRPMPGALSIVVTCMKFDSVGRLYLGGSDGFLRIATFPQDFIVEDVVDLNLQDVDVRVVPDWLTESPSPILSLDMSEELEMVVTAHANGNVCLHSMKEQQDVYNIATGKREIVGVIGVWNPFRKSKSYARSVTFTSKDTFRGTRYAVVVGGGNGEVWVNDIYPESKEGEPKGEVFQDGYVQKFQPNHVGPVISLASRPEGLIVSVGHDGMLRMTQTWIGGKHAMICSPLPLYGLGGYKVWIGSVCVDDEGKRLVSDGMDDAVIVHDFSQYEKDKNNR